MQARIWKACQQYFEDNGPLAKVPEVPGGPKVAKKQRERKQRELIELDLPEMEKALKSLQKVAVSMQEAKGILKWVIMAMKEKLSAGEGH